jgi:hypothetical protein
VINADDPHTFEVTRIGADGSGRMDRSIARRLI